MAKLSNKDCSGTSFLGDTITTTVAQLEKVIGKAQCQQNDGKDKSNFDWTCETEKGDVFTIYDWKEYRKLKKTETITFHIGGHSEEATSTAKRELTQLLK